MERLTIGAGRASPLAGLSVARHFDLPSGSASGFYCGRPIALKYLQAFDMTEVDRQQADDVVYKTCQCPESSRELPLPCR